MKVIYDKESDTLSIILRAGKVAESDEGREGLIMDYDKSGRLLSLELLDAIYAKYGDAGRFDAIFADPPAWP